MNILVTGARSTAALELIRNFGFNGNVVYAADSIRNPICKYSKFLKKYFFVPSAKFDENKYIEQLVNILNDFNIDVLFPVCEEIFYISRNKRKLEKFYPNLKILTDDFDKLKLLHNKFEFYKMSKNLGIPTAESILVSDKYNLDEFIKKNGKTILRSVFSRFGTSAFVVCSVNEVKNKFLNQNFIASKFISGGKLVCYYCYCENGEVKFDISYSSSFKSSVNACTVFEVFKNNSKIKRYAEKIIKSLKLSGNISFDFIYDGNVFYIIECNPRITSGIHILSKNNFEKMFFGNMNFFATKEDTQILLLNMFNFKNYNLRAFKKIFSIRDILFSKEDLKPFFMMPKFIFEMLRISVENSISLIDATTYDINWNGD